MLPKLLKPPSSYTNYIYQWDELDEKISHALTSPLYARYKTAKAGTYKFLMLSRLAKRDLEIARQKQVAFYKAKLSARANILKGGIMLALEALKIKKEKEIKLQLETLKKAKAALVKAKREEREVQYR